MGKNPVTPPGAAGGGGARAISSPWAILNNPNNNYLYRKALKGFFLLQLARSEVLASPSEAPRADHLQTLLNATGSELERRWLRFLDERGLRLPTAAQRLITACHTRPDFVYDEHRTAVYVDGSPHEFIDRQERDKQQSDCLW